MATRRKPTDPWRIIGSVEENPDIIIWRHRQSGDLRHMPSGIHPSEHLDGMPQATDPAAAAHLHLVEAPSEAKPQEEHEESPLDRVNTLLSVAFGDDRAYIAVYRLARGVREWCKRYSPSEIEEQGFDVIRSDFGAGEYELRLYGTDPLTQKFGVRRSARITMATDPTRRNDQTGLPTGLAQMVQTISQGQQQMLEALVQMKQQPQKDPMEEMTKMLGMMTMMRQAMGIDQQTQQKSSIAEVVDAIKELRGAASEVLPEKEPESLMGMLPKVLDIVSQGQQAQQQGPQLPMHQPAAAGVLSPVTLPPGFATAQPTEPAPTTEEDDDEMNPFHALKLRNYAKRLVEYAIATAPIAEAAQFVYDNIPDPLIDIMETDAWFAVFSAAYPAVKPHKDYLQKVRDAALKLFEDDDEPQAA